ncbi:MAG TPA: ethanolamine ammonia-lyase subunit EutC [Polyangiales bacterium]|nr:ethanolamine ammonia-lyase subunit EutC [Polyangiales bacterium]
MSDWNALRRYTQARIGLARSGAALTTSELLSFQLAHAQARDAVWHHWDVEACARELERASIPQLMAASRATDRAIYLKRPDLGRRLAPESLSKLTAARSDPPAEVCLILSDGLSATAVQTHGIATIDAIWRALAKAGTRCSLVVLVSQARVALSDEIGSALGAKLAVIVLGERPGLSAADSLGIYLTYDPKLGNSDAQRNCISNVRSPSGLPPALAAERLVSLLHRSLALGVSGIALKDEGPQLP